MLGGGNDQTDEAAAAFGLVIEQMDSAQDGGLWPDHLAAVQVFSALMTQWRWTQGGVTGLDYPAIPVVLDLYGITDRAEIFEQLRVLENEGIKELNRQWQTR